MSNRKIAETVELDKNTVNKYINQAKKDSLSIDELLLSTIRFLPIAWWKAMQPIQMPDLT